MQKWRIFVDQLVGGVEEHMVQNDGKQIKSTRIGSQGVNQLNP